MAVESLPARRCHTATARLPPPSRYRQSFSWCARIRQALGSVTSGMLLAGLGALRLLQDLVQFLLLACGDYAGFRRRSLVDPPPARHRFPIRDVHATAACTAWAVPHCEHPERGMVLAVAAAPLACHHVVVLMHGPAPSCRSA